MHTPVELLSLTDLENTVRLLSGLMYRIGDRHSFMTTPVLEAARLQEDLRRAGIEPWAWVVNASLAATGTRHPLLAARAATELTEIATVRDDLSERFAVVPMLAEEPVGPKRLRALAGAEPELV
jgi:arsenite-transporting ATPase